MINQNSTGLGRFSFTQTQLYQIESEILKFCPWTSFCALSNYLVTQALQCHHEASGLQYKHFTIINDAYKVVRIMPQLCFRLILFHLKICILPHLCHAYFLHLLLGLYQQRIEFTSNSKLFTIQVVSQKYVAKSQISKGKNRLLKFCYVPATSAAHNRLLFSFFCCGHLQY